MRPGSRVRPLCRLSGLAEVEGGATGGTEVNGHRLGVVRVDVQAGGSQHGIEADRAAEGFAQAATAVHTVGVELEGGTVLLALEHVFHHPVGEGSVLVGHVHGGSTRAVAETTDVAAEGHVLAGGLTDRGDVNLGAGDFKTPVADLADHSELGVGHLKLVGGGGGAVVGDIHSGTTGGGGHLKGTSAGGVGNHVVGGGQGKTGGKGAGSGAAGLAVHHAELHRISNFEVQVGLNGDGFGRGVDAGLTERSGRTSGFVVESAGRAGQDSGGHRGVPRGYVGRALPGLSQVSACGKHYSRKNSCHVRRVNPAYKMRRFFCSGKCRSVYFANADEYAAVCFSGVVDGFQHVDCGGKQCLVAGGSFAFFGENSDDDGATGIIHAGGQHGFVGETKGDVYADIFGGCIEWGSRNVVKIDRNCWN